MFWKQNPKTDKKLKFAFVQVMVTVPATKIIATGVLSFLLFLSCSSFF